MRIDSGLHCWGWGYPKIISIWTIRRRSTGQNGILPAFAVSIAGFMAMNVAALCLVIFVIYRYLNYTQGLFWIVFYLVFREIFRGRG